MRLKDLEDGELVHHTREGNLWAFSELVKRHQGVVYRLCYRVLNNREDAKDASQESFLRAYRKLDTFRGRGSVKGWLLRVATNVSLNERRGYKVSLAGDEEVVALPEPETPESKLDESEAAARVREVLALVTPDERAAVALRDLEGLTYKETAEALGVPEGTVKTRVRRGRRRLKELLK